MPAIPEGKPVKKRRRRWRRAQIEAVLSLCEFLSDKEIAARLGAATGEIFKWRQVQRVRFCHDKYKLPGTTPKKSDSFAKRKRTKDPTGEDFHAKERKRTAGYWRKCHGTFEANCPSPGCGIQTFTKSRLRTMCPKCRRQLHISSGKPAGRRGGPSSIRIFGGDFGPSWPSHRNSPAEFYDPFLRPSVSK
jgi:hypothetical protein